MFCGPGLATVGAWCCWLPSPGEWLQGTIAALGGFDREASLRGAIEVFKRSGPGRTDPQELQSATGLSSEQIEQEFGGERLLYLEALRRNSNDNVARFLAAIEGPHGLERALFDLVDRMEKEGGQALGIFAIAEFGRADADVNAVLEDAWRSLSAGLEPSRLSGIEAGTIDASISHETFVEFMKVTLIGLRMSASAGTPSDTLRASAQHALRSLRPQT